MLDRSHLRLAALGLGCLAAAPAHAEPPADRTGTGSGPGSTLTAPNTDSLGVTKPPGTSLGPDSPGERRELNRIRRQNDAIDDSICADCGAK